MNKCSNVSCDIDATNYIILQTNDLRKCCELHSKLILISHKNSIEISKEDFKHLLNNPKFLAVKE